MHSLSCAHVQRPMHAVSPMRTCRCAPVKEAAGQALAALAVFCGYGGSLRALVAANADYVVSQVFYRFRFNLHSDPSSVTRSRIRSHIKYLMWLGSLYYVTGLPFNSLS